MNPCHRTLAVCSLFPGTTFSFFLKQIFKCLLNNLRSSLYLHYNSFLIHKSPFTPSMEFICYLLQTCFLISHMTGLTGAEELVLLGRLYEASAAQRPDLQTHTTHHVRDRLADSFLSTGKVNVWILQSWALSQSLTVLCPLCQPTSSFHHLLTSLWESANVEQITLKDNSSCSSFIRIQTKSRGILKVYAYKCCCKSQR